MMTQKQYTLVTGATSGIGREVASFLASTRPVILHGRSKTRLEELSKYIDQSHRPVSWCHDLLEVDAIESSLCSMLLRNGIGVSSFVHCAAVMSVLPLRNINATLFRDHMSINAFSAFEITRLLVRKSFQAGKMTSIVLISSIASGFGAKGFCLYASTKGAIDSFVKSAAVELAPATRVNSVLPGAIETPMTAEMFRRPEIKARFDSCYPLGTGVPADVAKTVAFLLSDDSRWITGQNIILDGGRTSNVSA